MTRYPTRLWIVVLALGFTFDALFWEQAVGVNFALFTSLTALAGIVLLLSYGLRPSGKSLWWLLPFAFFTSVTFLRQEPLTSILAFTFSMLSLGLLAVSYLGGRWPQYGWLDYFLRFFQLLGSIFIRPVLFNEQVRKDRAEGGEKGAKVPYFALLRGLLIALPIVLCLGSLLAAGDLVFEHKLAEFFDEEKIGEYITRTLWILLSAYALAGVFLHAAWRSRDEKLVGEEKPPLRPFLGFPEAVVVLASVNLLFLTFVVVQFQYFFGGEANIGIEGYTYSQYARRGFNELVTAAFFSLLLVIASSTFTRRENSAQRRVFSGLNVALVALVLIVLVSAYQRIMLAIDWHGYSRLRLYPCVFLIWVGILFVVVVVLELLGRERSFALATVLASLGFALSLSVLNVDAAIVRHNIPRVQAGKNLNVIHLSSLSTDSIPPLVEEFQSERNSPVTHERIGAILLCYMHFNPFEENPDHDWRSFNLSRWEASKAFLEVRGELQAYGVNEKQWPVRVRTPNYGYYDCTYYQEERD